MVGIYWGVTTPISPPNYNFTISPQTTEVEDMRRPDVGEQLPPPILPNGKHRTENFSSLGASARPLDLRPQVDCCPICGRNNFASQADLELHSATCTNFN